MRRTFFAIGVVVTCLMASLNHANEPAGDNPKANDSEIRGLLKRRYEAALGETEATMALYHSGRVSLEQTCGAIQRFSTAATEMAETAAERVKQCQRAFEFAKSVEATAKAKHEADVEPVQAMKLATYTRLDMEIKLHQAQREAGIPQDQEKQEQAAKKQSSAKAAT